jgi:hypothetical protein
MARGSAKSTKKEIEMNSSKRNGAVLKDVNIDVKVKLAALWTAVMFLFAYNDIIHFGMVHR